MRRFRTFLPALVVSLLVATASAQMQTPITHHMRAAVANGQAKVVGHLPANQTLRLVLVLPLRNQAELDNLLQDLYNPSSPSYHHFLTVDEFTARVRPHPGRLQHRSSTFAEEQRPQGRRHFAQPREPRRHRHRGRHQPRLPRHHEHLSAPDREPHLLRAGSRAHRRSALPALAHRRPRQLLHSASRRTHPASCSCRQGQSNATTGSGPSASFLGSDMRAAYYGADSLTGTGQYLGLLEYYGTDLADLQTYYTNAGTDLSRLHHHAAFHRRHQHLLRG